MDWRDMATGNVVRWAEGLWIISKITENGLELLKFDGFGMHAYPTTNWPDDPDRRVDSVKWVADNPKDMLFRLINNLLRSMEGK